VTAFSEACMEGEAARKDGKGDAEDVLKRAAQAEASAMEIRAGEEEVAE